MKKFVMLFLPIAGVLILQLLLLDWAARSSGQPLRETLTPLSVSVAVLILVTGVLPALVRPQPVHTLIACFATLFGLFLVVPFDVSDMPALHSGVPTYRFLGPYLLLRLVNAAILLPLAVHVSARFPRPTSVSPKMLSGGYILSLFLLAAFLLSSTFWQRILSTGLSFLWFTIVIGFFVWNLLVVARDPRPEGAHDAQQARIVMFSVLIAEIPLWLRPLTLALGLDIFPYNLLLVFQLVIPIGIAYAVLQHDLFGIDRVLRRTLAYGAVSLALLMLYLGFATALTVLFANLTSQSLPIVTVIGLLLAALLFEPARRFTQKWLDKLLYPDRLKFQLAVRSVQASLAQANRRDDARHWIVALIFPADQHVHVRVVLE